MNLAGTGCRWLLGILFLAAGVMKAADPNGFINDVDSYRLVEGWPLVALSFFVPFLEMAVGVALVIRRPYRGGVLAAAGLLLMFLVALSQAWIRDLDINCGCFVRGPTVTNYPWWVARDIALLAACWICWADALRFDPVGETP